MKVIISKRAMALIKFWVDKCPYEIAGMGTVLLGQDGTVYVDNVELLTQKVTGASVDMDAESINTLAYEKRLEGDLRFHWHSHVNMSAFFSGTDRDGYRDYVKHGGWLLAGVFNKKGESKYVYYQGQDAEYPALIHEDIEVSVFDELTEGDTLWAEHQYASRVKLEPKQLNLWEGTGTENDWRVDQLKDMATPMPNPNLLNNMPQETYMEIAEQVEEDYDIKYKDFNKIWQLYIHDFKDRPRNYHAMMDYIDTMMVKPNADITMGDSI